MRLNGTETLLIILVTALGIQATRWLPFLVFPEKKEPPAWVLYLGRVLPAAMMGLLVVYCLRNVSPTAPSRGLPELLATAAVVLMHRWKENVLLSIAGGTALYMLLVQVIFA